MGRAGFPLGASGLVRLVHFGCIRLPFSPEASWGWSGQVHLAHLGSKQRNTHCHTLRHNA